MASWSARLSPVTCSIRTASSCRSTLPARTEKSSLYTTVVPSQFSAIGFMVASPEDLAALASRVAERAETIDAGAGQYLKWAPPSGEQLWLQLRRNGDAMGMNPHFEGKSSVRVA